MINLTTLAFWRKKESETPESERIIPLPPLPKHSIVQTPTVSQDDINKTRDALKVLLLERQIIGSALTTIFESEVKGIISQVERDRLVSKYKLDLEQLNKVIADHQRTVDLYDLEKSREQLVRDFDSKLAEIDSKIKNLRNPDPNPNPFTIPPGIAMPGKQIEEQHTTDAEKRVEQIRDEILKAMDRLEQIESEG